jgi:hypothetical protein
MYNDKDFEGKSSYVKSNRESTGIMTRNMSGRVNDEYQFSDLDFPVQNNHTFNISINQLSINDSSSYHIANDASSYQRPQESNSFRKITQNSTTIDDSRWRNGRESGNTYKTKESGYSKGRESGYDHSRTKKIVHHP